ALWGRVDSTPTGGGAVATVDSHGTRIGGVVAAAVGDGTDPPDQLPPALSAPGRRASGPGGAAARRGAPWSRDEWAGVLLEAGARGGFLDGQVSSAGSVSFGMPSTSIPPPTTKKWQFVSPYVGGTFVLQLSPRTPVRPFFGLSVLLSGN